MTPPPDGIPLGWPGEGGRRERSGIQVLLCTEGTYPFSLGGVSTWCDQLIRGLAPAGYRFTVQALHAHPGVPHPRLPPNVTGLHVAQPGKIPSPGQRWSLSPKVRPVFEVALEAVVLGCAGQTDRFARGLQDLAELAGTQPLWPLFARRSTQRLVAQALRQLSPFPVTPQDVRLTTNWLRDMLVPVLEQPEPVDLAVATSAGLGALPAWLAHRRRGVSLVLVEHGVALREALLALQASAGPPSFKALRAAFHEALARLLYRDADAVVAVCTFNTTWELRLGVTPERSRVIHNGIDPAEYPSLTHHINSPPTVGWIGRIDPLKGLDLLVQAFAQVVRTLPRARLRLFGPTPRGNEAYYLRVKQEIQAAGLSEQVTFEGVPDSVQEALRQSDVIALPSVSEGLPYVLLEAMMAGRAVVAHEVGGVPEAMGDAGRLIGLHDTSAFARALTDLLCDPGERAILGQLARERAISGFTVQAMLNRYEQTFAELLSGGLP